MGRRWRRNPTISSSSARARPGFRRRCRPRRRRAQRGLPVPSPLVEKATRGRSRRQYPLDAGLYADGGARSRRGRLRARHARRHRLSGRRDLLRAARRRRACDHRVDREPRRRVPPADLLSRQGPAAHPAGRRRRGDPSRADAGRGRSRAWRFAIRARWRSSWPTTAARCAKWRSRRRWRAGRHSGRCGDPRLRRLSGRRAR